MHRLVPKCLFTIINEWRNIFLSKQCLNKSPVMKRQVLCLFNFSSQYSCAKNKMSDLVPHLSFINSILGESLILYTYTPQKTAIDISILRCFDTRKCKEIKRNQNK